ncbi:MAG TPA: alcohol dehydrogenase-like regulatory protein ErcA [Verrucomicrobiae bacterium]|nr:alcohol dehydrogenase-like regulatory protein ErcA [Verrucomicrobiae bacterium]
MEGSGYVRRKFVAPEFVFGDGARSLVPRYARNFGIHRALLVSDPGVMAAGWGEEVAAILAEDGIDCTLFSRVTSNPRSDEVMEGAELYLSRGCNGIIAVGGGSPIDCAKGIGIISSSPDTHVLDYEGVDVVDHAAPPLVCVPTTAGSAAELSQFAIITDADRGRKIAIVSKAVVPDAALIDPLTTTTLDPYGTACTAMDALCHGIEAYVSLAHSPVTDLHALEAVRLVWGSLQRVLEDPQDLRARGRMLLASVHAGLAFSNASLGAVHALAHSLGGMADIAHGAANAVLLAPVVALNFDSAAGRYAHIAEAAGLAPAGAPPDEVRDALLGGLRKLREDAALPGDLSGAGLSAEDLPAMAENALRDPCMVTNPLTPTLQDVERIYGSLL